MDFGHAQLCGLLHCALTFGSETWLRLWKDARGDVMSADGFIPLEWNELPEDEMKLRAIELFERMNIRRTTRHFSNRMVPKELIEYAIKCGSTAPSGAHLQPWTFVAVSNQELKEKMRKAAEKEERENLL